MSSQVLRLKRVLLKSCRRALLNQASTLLRSFPIILLCSACFALVLAAAAGAARFSPHRRDLLLALVLFFLGTVADAL